VLDCRGMGDREAGVAILEAYNAAGIDSEFSALVDPFGPGLRMWLIEAGAKHTARQTDTGAWALEIRRGLSPGQGTIPGLHHVETTHSATVWTCERAHRLARIDGSTGDVIKVAEVAKKASHLTVDPEERWVFVADPGANALHAVATEDLSVRHTWAAPGAPQLPLVTDDGVVCVTGGGTGTLTIVQPRRGGYDARTIEVGACPHDPIATADGKTVFVPCAGEGVIAKVDLGERRVTARYPAGDGPAHLALHPDGTRLYSANTFDGTLSCLSVDGDLLAQQPSGEWAHQPAISPDGKVVYVANFLDDTLSVFDAERMEVVASLEAESYPHGLDISADGRWAIATGFSSDYLRVYDARSHEQVARIEVGRGSSHIAFLPNENTVYVACSVDDHLARVSLDSLSVTGRVSLHRGPSALRSGAG